MIPWLQCPEAARWDGCVHHVEDDYCLAEGSESQLCALVPRAVQQSAGSPVKTDSTSYICFSLLRLIISDHKSLHSTVPCDNIGTQVNVISAGKPKIQKMSTQVKQITSYQCHINQLPKTQDLPLVEHIHHDILNPPQRLTSRKLLWCVMTPTNIKSHWRESWKSATVVNAHLVNNPTIQQPGFTLPRQQWPLPNHFRTSQGHCRACKDLAP